MKLNVQERLILSKLIPETGNFSTMDTVEKLKNSLFLSEKEVEEFQLKQTDTTITWNEKGAKASEVKISDKGMEILKEAFKKLDEKEELSLQHFHLFKRFKETK